MGRERTSHPPMFATSRTPGGVVGKALLRCRTIAEAHVVGAYLVLREAGTPVTYAALAWAISEQFGGGQVVHLSYVKRGLADALRNQTLTRTGPGVYERGPAIADLVDAPSDAARAPKGVDQ